MRHQRKIRVLLIDEKDDYHAVNIVRCLQQSDIFDLHCITAAPAHKLRFSIRCKTRHVRLDSPAALLEAVRSYNSDQPIDVVIPIQVPMIVMAGTVAEELNVFTRLAPSSSPDLCQAIDDKWQLRKVLSSTGIKMPRSLTSDSERNELERELSSWGSSFITKPLCSSGGDGIRTFESLAELLESLYANPMLPADPVIIEEYIPGHDMDCNVISINGTILAHTIQRVSLTQNKSFTAGLGLEFVHDEAISTLATEFVRASKMSGVANMDLRVDDRTGEVYLIEVNPRYWQTLLGSMAMGINFPEMHCRLALGEHIPAGDYREGRWVDLHALSNDPVNLKRLFANREHSWRHIDLGLALSDPLPDAIYFLDAFQRHVRIKARAFLGPKHKDRVLADPVAD